MEIIQNNDWFLIVDLNGGRIRELKYKNEVFLGTYKRIDGKDGNTHVCCPNFGSEGMEKFNLPFHGPFRNMEWKLVDKDKTNLEIEAESLDLNVKQIFEIDSGFKQIIKIKNLDNNSRIINVAIHNYWDAKSSWNGTKLNGEVIDNFIKSDLSKFLLPENIIEIPNKPKYKWILSGFKYAQFWTSFKDVNKEKMYDETYLCIEPSLEEQGFLESEGINNLAACGFLEFIQSIEVLEK